MMVHAVTVRRRVYEAAKAFEEKGDLGVRYLEDVLDRLNAKDADEAMTLVHEVWDFLDEKRRNTRHGVLVEVRIDGE